MRLQEGADPVAVTWHFAKKGADLIGVPTPFCSSVWELGEDTRFASYLGEQSGPRPYSNGIGSAGLAGRRLCFPLEWFRSGVPAGQEIAVAVDRSELPLCCQETEGSTGGVVCNGRGDCPPPPPFDCLTLPDSLSCSVASVGGGCAGLTQAISLIRSDPMTCIWDGVLTTWLGNALISLNIVGVTPSLAISCFAGPPTIVLGSFVQSPLSIVFDVTDTAACCSFAGTDLFTVTITG